MSERKSERQPSSFEERVRWYMSVAQGLEIDVGDGMGHDLREYSWQVVNLYGAETREGQEIAQERIGEILERLQEGDRPGVSEAIDQLAFSEGILGEINLF